MEKPILMDDPCSLPVGCDGMTFSAEQPENVNKHRQSIASIVLTIRFSSNDDTSKSPEKRDGMAPSIP